MIFSKKKAFLLSKKNRVETFKISSLKSIGCNIHVEKKRKIFPFTNSFIREDFLRSFNQNYNGILKKIFTRCKNFYPNFRIPQKYFIKIKTFFETKVFSFKKLFEKKTGYTWYELQDSLIVSSLQLTIIKITFYIIENNQLSPEKNIILFLILINLNLKIDGIKNIREIIVEIIKKFIGEDFYERIGAETLSEKNLLLYGQPNKPINTLKEKLMEKKEKFFQKILYSFVAIRLYQLNNPYSFILINFIILIMLITNQYLIAIYIININLALSKIVFLASDITIPNLFQNLKSIEQSEKLSNQKYTIKINKKNIKIMTFWIIRTYDSRNLFLAAYKKKRTAETYYKTYNSNLNFEIFLEENYLYLTKKLNFENCYKKEYVEDLFEYKKKNYTLKILALFICCYLVYKNSLCFNYSLEYFILENVSNTLVVAKTGASTITKTYKIHKNGFYQDFLEKKDFAKILDAAVKHHPMQITTYETNNLRGYKLSHETTAIKETINKIPADNSQKVDNELFNKKYFEHQIPRHVTETHVQHSLEYTLLFEKNSKSQKEHAFQKLLSTLKSFSKKHNFSFESNTSTLQIDLIKAETITNESTESLTLFRQKMNLYNYQRIFPDCSHVLSQILSGHLQTQKKISISRGILRI